MEDPCSLSNLLNFKVKHLDWFVNANFDSHIFDCEAKLTVECIKEGSIELVLDSSDLTVEEVTVNSENVTYEIGAENKPFGRPLKISLPNPCAKGQEFVAAIKYKTSPNATAVQWLKPEQTLGKKLSYLFTQCQAIHARSLLPIQDSPGIKFTYTAQVNVPDVMVALMSAVKGKETKNGNGRKICHFQQKVPIPAYLLAIAVGALEFRPVGPRSKVWCEAEMVDACAYEFAKVEDMLQAGEALMGPYVWGQYDILVLPPSFPYGGMENPCLTFATPTLLNQLCSYSLEDSIVVVLMERPDLNAYDYIDITRIGFTFHLPSKSHFVMRGALSDAFESCLGQCIQE